MPAKLSFVFFFVLSCTVNLFAHSEKNDTTFVASREWQTVRKGQPIPSGLHVRHNFQTGLTEAKLLDESADENSDENDDVDKRTKSLVLHPDESLHLPEDDDADNINIHKKEADRLKISLEEIKSRLKKIQLVDEDNVSNNAKSKSDAQERFKSYTNLKNEFNTLDVNVTTDAEILAAFFQRFENHRDHVTTGFMANSVVDDVLQILNNLEYLLHQIDNAQIFADMGGMAKIVSPCFNTSNDEIKSEALRLLGTSVQSNPKVQAKALEQDFIQKLLHILVINNKVNVQSRCLFALGALVRQYSIAQKALIDHGGLEIFGQILEDGHLQTQSRIMKLISDLVVERDSLRAIEDEILRQRKIQEYLNTDFESKLLEQKYCKHLSNLMIRSFSNEAFGHSNIEDYGFLSIIVDSMLTIASICKNDFRSDRYSIVAVIRETLRHYESVRDSTTSTNDDYSFGHLASQLAKLRKIVYEEVNDEL